MENLGYLLEDDDISPAVKRRSRTQTAASAQLENVSNVSVCQASGRRGAVISGSDRVERAHAADRTGSLFAGLPQPDLQAAAGDQGRSLFHHVQVPHHVRECRTKAGGASCSE